MTKRVYVISMLCLILTVQAGGGWAQVLTSTTPLEMQFSIASGTIYKGQLLEKLFNLNAEVSIFKIKGASWTRYGVHVSGCRNSDTFKIRVYETDFESAVEQALKEYERFECDKK